MFEADLVVLLIALAVLCVRADYVKRAVPLVLAALFWGAARFVADVQFRGRFQEYEGIHQISPGIAMQVVAMVLCALCLFWATRGARPKGSLPPPSAAPGADDPPSPTPPGAPRGKAKLERLRQPED